MSRIYYKEELDKLTCHNPGCDHTAHEGLLLLPRCHGEGSQVHYEDGELEITCKVCKAPVVKVAVASRGIVV